MTISSEVRKAGPYVGNGVTTVFPFLFKVFSAADVSVTIAIPATGAETLLASGYTVALNADQNANPGGSVTYNPSGVPIPSTQTLTIGSVVTNTQGTHLLNGGAWLPQNVEDMVDRTTIEIQQLAEKVARALLFPISEVAPASGIPSIPTRKNRVLGFDSNGALTTYPITSIVLTGVSIDVVIATAGQTLVSTGHTYVPAVNSLAVFRNGVRQEGGGVDYTETTTSSVTFTSGLSAGDKILFAIGQF